MLLAKQIMCIWNCVAAAELFAHWVTTDSNQIMDLKIKRLIMLSTKTQLRVYTIQFIVWLEFKLKRITAARGTAQELH